MTERGLPTVDGAPACPFVAFADERDERASSPDHRHRCYAEAKPAPRALAHQEAYCLSSAFPVCPTFQDWARREAARARQGPADAPAAALAARDGEREADHGRPETAGGATVAGAGAAAIGAGALDDEVEAPGFLAGRSRPGLGLAGSAADRLAGPGDEPRPASPRPQPSSPNAARPGERTTTLSDLDEADEEDDDEAGWDDEPASRRERGSRLGAGLPFGDRRPKVGDTRPRRRDVESEHAWERSGRHDDERRGGLAVLASVPPVAVIALALLIAAVALFFLPALLGVGRQDDPTGGGGGASPSPTAAPSVAASPTPTPEPTPLVYVVQRGDTLSRIASQFGVSLAQLIDANRDTVPDPNRLQIGDQLIIPTADASPAGGAASPRASP